MQISFHTKRLHFIFLGGDDADPGSESEPETFVSLAGGDLSIAPTEEQLYWEEEEGKHQFGFSPVQVSNVRPRRPRPGV